MVHPSLPILLRILSSFVWAAFAYGGNETISPNCLSSCGATKIPYPFGVGEGCYRDKRFEILCRHNTSNSSSSTPFLGVTGYEVKYIVANYSALSVWILSKYTRTYFTNRSGGAKTFDMTQTPFSLSRGTNMLYGVGCGTIAHIADLKSHNFMTKCVSLCQNYIASYSDDCNQKNGSSCSMSRMPRNLKAFKLTVDRIDSSYNGTGYAMVQQDKDYVHGGNHGSFEKENFTRISLKWVIGNETCEEAKRNSTSFACQHKNTNCVDSSNGGGYFCTCSRGYKGNPYLPDNCKDIDECGRYEYEEYEDYEEYDRQMSYFNNLPKGRCRYEAHCVNTIGSFSCVCPWGWIGDGKREETRCSPKLLYTVIGVAGGVALLVIVAVAFFLYKKLKKRKLIKLKQKFFKKNGGLLLEQQISSGDGNIEKTKILVSEELERATDNFNKSRILGRGGSGTVYKGMLSDGRIAAIKKSQVIDESQTGQFINELVILSHINHRHIVQLFGCCLETEVPLLAYEFISNGTLSHHLHDEECKSSLSWDIRLRIATQISGALCYMHSSAATPIFHRDIKSSNILLDENFMAKVSDFGISRSVPCENTHLTTLVQGTFGYLDPEYFHSGQFTDKSDVYSFGVVLVELLTGQAPISSTRPEQDKNLAMYFISSVKQDRVFNILETRVLKEGSKEELLVVVKLAKQCLKLIGKKRPTMREVTMELERLRQVEEKESVRQNQKDTNQEDNQYWLYSSSSISMSGSESKETTMIWEETT